MKPDATERSAVTSKRWLSVREAALYLSVHEMTIRDWVSAGKIPASRIGRCIRIDGRELDRRLESQAAGQGEKKGRL